MEIKGTFSFWFDNMVNLQLIFFKTGYKIDISIYIFKEVNVFKISKKYEVNNRKYTIFVPKLVITKIADEIMEIIKKAPNPSMKYWVIDYKEWGINTDTLSRILRGKLEKDTYTFNNDNTCQIGKENFPLLKLKESKHYSTVAHTQRNHSSLFMNGNNQPPVDADTDLNSEIIDLFNNEQMGSVSSSFKQCIFLLCKGAINKNDEDYEKGLQIFISIDGIEEAVIAEILDLGVPSSEGFDNKKLNDILNGKIFKNESNNTFQIT